MKEAENEAGAEIGKIGRKTEEGVDLVVDIEAKVGIDLAGIGKEVEVRKEDEAEVEIEKGNTEVGVEIEEVEVDIEAGIDIPGMC